jgi:hypothetical protein
MSEKHFEGTLVLEMLAETGKLDEFYDAIDSDDFHSAEKLLRAAGVDGATIGIVLQKMREADDDH